MRSFSYLNSARSLLDLYKGELPFAEWLRQAFRMHKKYGSKDRKMIASLCFGYYRLGQSLKDRPQEERILTGLFLSAGAPHPVLQELKPEWNERATLPLEEKLSFLGIDTALDDLFPLAQELSETIDRRAFAASMLVQPDLFLRIRPGKKEVVERALHSANIPFQNINDEALALPNQSKIEEVVRLDEEAVVQDLNSQQVVQPFAQVMERDKNFTIWDCCAASGGKSILFHDHFPKAKLTVSDIRESIMFNLRKRFQRAGITSYQSFITDLTSPEFKQKRTFDLVLCDAPCSGSGTWARTPEQLIFFKQEGIEKYVRLQKSIAANAARSVSKGGYFLYITCSVFKKENEEVVDHLQKEPGLQLASTAYFTGYHQKSDTLFAALFSAL